MSLVVNANLKIVAIETLTGTFVDPNNQSFGLIGPSLVEQFTGSTTVPVTKRAAYELAMVAGVGSINLASLPGINSEEIVVGTALKAQFLVFRNKSTNANKITVAKGASNGYGLAASGDTWTVTLSPGQLAIFYLADAAPDVASGARVLDVTGTGAQILEFEVILG